MPRRHRVPPPQNMKPDRQKNVRDPAEHPLGMADDPTATGKRKDVSGDDHMRLPYEHDETADAQERAGGTDALMEQAREDATGEQQDTDRRSDAVDVFEGTPPAGRRRRMRKVR